MLIVAGVLVVTELVVSGTQCTYLLTVSRKRNQNEIFPEKYKETNNTSNSYLDVFSFFSRLISFWFRFLLTVNKYYQYGIKGID